MYRYDAVDRLIVEERVAQYRDQTRRYMAGLIDEDAFKPLRLQNGLYIQRYAPMLRIAIPYGVLSSDQLRALGAIARKYDRGYGHFTTRQNIQFNWVKVEEVPDILGELAGIGMHAIQTSGSCVRNVTTDALAGVAADEIVDPRPYCELMRQWSTLHPEFAHLPRKFKVAFNGAKEDRAATPVHDLAFDLYRDDAGEVRIIVESRRRTRTHAAACLNHQARPALERTTHLQRSGAARLQPHRVGATTSSRRASKYWSKPWGPKHSRRKSRKIGRICAMGRTR